MASEGLESINARRWFIAVAATLALGAMCACGSSSNSCTLPPGPVPVARIQAPCGLTFVSVTVSGPCQGSGTTAAPSVTGTGSGTCTVSATFTNGAHATGTVTFAPDGNVCETFTPTPDTVTLGLSGSSGCDAGTAADAAAD